MFSVLRERAFRRFWFSQVSSQFGDGITKTALIYQITIISMNPFLISLVLLAEMLPGIVLGPLAGSFADKFSKKQILVSADLFRLVIVLLMIPALKSAGWLLALMLCKAIGTAFFMPARSAGIRQEVGEEKVSEAVGMVQSTASALRLLAPSIAGLLLVLQARWLIFVIDAATFLLSAAFLSGLPSMKVAREAADTDASFKAKWSFGFQFVWAQSWLLKLFLLSVPFSLAVGMNSTNMRVIVLQRFHVPVVQYGLMEGMLGAGAIIGALIATQLSRRRSSFVPLCLGMCLLGLTMVLIYPLNSWRLVVGTVPVFGWIAFLGIATATANVGFNTLLMKTAKPQMLGRVAAVSNSFTSLTVIVGVCSVGSLDHFVGVIGTTACAGGLLLLTLLALPFLKDLKHMDLAQQTVSDSSP